MDGCNENVIEFMTNGTRATLSFSQGRYKSAIRKLAEKHPEDCRIIADNEDGSICAHVPVSWLRISPPRQYTEEQRQQMGDNFYNPVRSTGTTFIVEFVRITDYRDIWFYIVFIILIQEYGKRGNIGLARATFSVNIVSNLPIECSNDVLMLSGRRCHVVDLTVNQFCSGAFR